MTDEEVRRLLRQARHDEPLPPDVAARLDDVLADLVAERSTSGEAATVTPIASARRRRRTASLVLAAAAVVVAGVGIGQVISSGSGPGSGSDSHDAVVAQDREQEPRETSVEGDTAPAPSATERDALGDDSNPYDSSAPPHNSAAPGLPEVSSSTLADDLLAARLQVSPGASLLKDRMAGCAVPEAGGGTWLSVLLDGEPALVVFRAPGGGHQRADVYPCGSDEPIRSVRLPAP